MILFLLYMIKADNSPSVQAVWRMTVQVQIVGVLDIFPFESYTQTCFYSYFLPLFNIKNCGKQDKRCYICWTEENLCEFWARTDLILPETRRIHKRFKWWIKRSNLCEKLISSDFKGSKHDLFSFLAHLKYFSTFKHTFIISLFKDLHKTNTWELTVTKNTLELMQNSFHFTNVYVYAQKSGIGPVTLFKLTQKPAEMF